MFIKVSHEVRGPGKVTGLVREWTRSLRGVGGYHQNLVTGLPLSSSLFLPYWTPQQRAGSAGEHPLVAAEGGTPQGSACPQSLCLPLQIHPISQP